MNGAETLPGLLEAQAAARPAGVALRQKRLGLWRTVTWAEYAETVRAVALALDADGVGAGARVALFADNEPFWLYADLGIQAVGAATVALYPALDGQDAADARRAAGAEMVFCADQEHVDKLLDAEGGLAGVRKLVVLDLDGLHTPEYTRLPIEPFTDLLERGRSLSQAASDRIREIAAGRGGGDLASVSMTSGTSGPPRLVLLGQAGQVELAQAVARELGFGERDRGYALLPLANATSRLVDAYVPLVAGSSLAFPESHETVPQDMVEAQPSVLMASPRLLERTRGEIELRAQRAGWFKRRVAAWALHRLGAGTGEPSGGAAAAVADLVVGRFVRAKAGLAHTRFVGIGGSPVSESLLAWFRVLRVPVREVYGQTEAGGPVTVQRSAADAGTAGPPLAGIELRLDGEELLVKSPGLLVGALGEGRLPQDGWFRTGDLGTIDAGGRLVPLGRAVDRLVTAAGEQLAAADVENALKASPYVANAMVVAAGRPFVAALIELDDETVSDWARRAGVPVTTYGALVDNEQVTELLDREVAAANAGLPEALRVGAFRILPEPLLDELTPTGKIKRALVEQANAALIDAMYGAAKAGTAG